MTKYEAVAQAIKTDIENGVYTEGQAIPTEELLTAQYDVSRQTIRKALALLGGRRSYNKAARAAVRWCARSG